MFGFQTLTCLHEIPVIRSSTTKLQDVYQKAKKTSTIIRFPCDLAENMADKSLKVALTVADPLVKPLRGSVRAIDDFAVEKLRQIEAKYPVLTTPTEDVLNSLNEKAEPVRNVMNSMKETTTSTIQHGKQTVSQVASATVNKATDVADTVYTFCETHVPGKTIPVPRHEFGQRTTLLWERIKSILGLFSQQAYQLLQSLFIWFRMLIVFTLMKIKQFNDDILKKLPNKSLLTAVPQWLFILLGSLLESIIVYIRPDEVTEAEFNKNKHNFRPFSNKKPQTPQFLSRPTLKPDALHGIRQSSLPNTDDSKGNPSTQMKSSTEQSPLIDRKNLYPRVPTPDAHSTPSDQKSDFRKGNLQGKNINSDRPNVRSPPNADI